jgi:broad specificity phosphatase PhoE
LSPTGADLQAVVGICTCLKWVFALSEWTSFDLGVAQSGDNRDINRGRLYRDEWQASFEKPESAEQLLLPRLQAMFRTRGLCTAFHPDAKQEFLDFGHPSLFVLTRSPVSSPLPTNARNQASSDDAKSGSNLAAPWHTAAILCLTNFAGVNVEVDVSFLEAWRFSDGSVFDVLTEQWIPVPRIGLFKLLPYQIVWLSAPAYGHVSSLLAPGASFVGLRLKDPRAQWWLARPNMARKVVHFVRHGEAMHNQHAALLRLQTGQKCRCCDLVDPTQAGCPFLDLANVDAALTPLGHAQAALTASTFTLISPPAAGPLVILSSPLTRALETSRVFHHAVQRCHLSVPVVGSDPSPALCTVIALESLRAQMSPHTHSKASSLDVLSARFPEVDLTDVKQRRNLACASFCEENDAKCLSEELDWAWAGCVNTSARVPTEPPAKESRDALLLRSRTALQVLWARAEPEVMLVTHFTNLVTLFQKPSDAHFVGPLSCYMEKQFGEAGTTRPPDVPLIDILNDDSDLAATKDDPLHNLRWMEEGACLSLVLIHSDVYYMNARATKRADM